MSFDVAAIVERARLAAGRPSASPDAGAGTDAARLQLEQIAQQFEAMLLTQMLRDMRTAGQWEDEASGDTYGAQSMYETLDVELATGVPTEELPRWEAYAAEDPRNAKHDLAFRIVAMYHGEDAARAARAHFEKTVIQGDVPEDMPEVAPETGTGTAGLLDLIRLAGFALSNAEARRLVQQGAVSIDGEKVDDPYLTIDLAARAPFVVKVGKRRFAQIEWKAER